MSGPRAPFAVRLLLLGPARLQIGRAPPRPLERHDALLLALLAIEGPMHRAHLAQLLWPRSASRDATGSLRQRLHRLALVAGGPVVQGQAQLQLALHVRHEMTAEHACSPAAADGLCRDLLEALECEGEPELADWLALVRRRWREWSARRLAQLAQALEDAGDLEGALQWAERLRARAPAQESSHQRVMRLHHLRGDAAAALGAYRLCVAQLEQDLGLAPGDEIEAMRQMVEAGTLEPAVPEAAALVLRRPPRLVGRRAELQAAEQALREGRVVLVEGEAGIGKSRLLDELAALQGQGVCRVGARAADQGRPHALLARLVEALQAAHGLPAERWVAIELARLLPQLRSMPSEVPAVGDKPQLDAAWKACLSRAVAGGLSLIVVDDLHGADPASLRCLLAQIDSAAQPSWLLATRRGEVPAALERWLASPAGRGVLRLPLAGLSREALGELVQAVQLPLAWADALWAHTAGHPLFALQTLLACPAAQRRRGPQAPLPVPAQLGLVIERRLLEVSPPALRLAQLAALAGDAFSVPLAAAVLQQHALDLAAPWRELEATQILRDGAFVHELIREAALRTVPAVIATELHRQIAGHAEPLGLPLSTKAWHLEQAASPAQAAVAFAEAARAGGQQGDWSSALSWWDRAAANHLAADDADAAWAAERAATAIAQEIADDDDATRRLQRLLEGSRAGAQRAQALILKARSAVAHARFNEAELAAREALGCAVQLNAAQVVEAAALHGLSLATLKRHDEALVLFARHAAAARTLAEPWPRSEFLSAQGHAHAQADQLREAIAAWEAAAQGALRAGRVGDAVVNLLNASGTASFLGQLQHALRLAEQARALRATLASGHALADAAATMQRGTLHIALGRYGEAHHSLTQALQQWTGEGVKTWRVVAENSLAYLYWLLGQHARARQALATPLGLGEPGFARRQVIQARLKLQPPEASRASLRAALDQPAPTDRGITRFGAQLALAALAAPPQRVAEFAALLHEAREREHLSVALHACIRRADALRETGEIAASAAATQEAIAMADAGCIPHDLYLGEFWWLACRSLQAAGDADAARTALLRGETWVREVALPNVAEPFRDSFMHRNEVNARLLPAARRATGAA